MKLFELLLLSVGLAMDSFAVSICKGLSVRKAGIRESFLCGAWFGIFQGLMPFLGYLAASLFEKWIKIVAPWVAFGLLTIIGVNMIREAFQPEEEEKEGFGFSTMLMLAIATSIDALAVGITFVAVPVEVLNAGKMQNTLFAVIMICVITFIISAAGVQIGNLFGSRYRSGSEVAGGTILLFIGFRTLIESLDTSGTLSSSDTVFGMLIPLLATVAGAAFVYARTFLADDLRAILAGTSAGIMFSISVWGMITPAMNGFSSSRISAIIPVSVSFFLGVVMQYALDHLVPHTHAFAGITEGPRSNLASETKLMLAEVIHHVPEGIALGAIYAGHFMETDWISASTALVLSVAIAVQNFPEAVFVSLPVMDSGVQQGKAFFLGVVSGAPVPILGIVTVVVNVLFPQILPYVMSLAGGAMIYATVEDIPQITSTGENDKGTLAFVVGFAVVMLMIFAK